MLSVIDLMILEQLEKENESCGCGVSGCPEEEEGFDGSRIYPAPPQSIEPLGRYRESVPPTKDR